jgi:hypothetical protein
MASPWQASVPTKGRKRSLVEAVGIDTAGERRNVNADGSRSEPAGVNAPMGRRPIAFAIRKIKARRRGRLLIMVEAVGIEPTSEELRSPVSPCAAG